MIDISSKAVEFCAEFLDKQGYTAKAAMMRKLRTALDEAERTIAEIRADRHDALAEAGERIARMRQARDDAMAERDAAIARATEAERALRDDFSEREQVFRIGRMVAGEELDDDQAERLGLELQAISRFCPNCRGTGVDGDPPDSNGEGAWIGDCSRCGGSGQLPRTDRAALAKEGGDENT